MNRRPPPAHESVAREPGSTSAGLANTVISAKNTLSSDGDLPTLDPLSKAMAAVGLMAGGPSSGLFALGEPHDPMPRVPGSPTVPMPKPNPGTPGIMR